MTVPTLNISFNLQWVAQESSEQTWIARCDPRGLVLEESSLEKLYSLIPEAMEALFRDLIEADEPQRFLLDRGWSRQDVPAVSRDTQDLSVPWQLIAAGRNNDSELVAHSRGPVMHCPV